MYQEMEETRPQMIRFYLSTGLQNNIFLNNSVFFFSSKYLYFTLWIEFFFFFLSAQTNQALLVQKNCSKPP